MNAMRMLGTVLVLTGLYWLAGVSPAADEKKGEGDKSFTMKASAAGLAEVNLSNLAVARATSAEVRTFAQRMVADHTRANRELIELANQKMLPLAKSMDEKHQSLFDKMSKLNGADFDHAYMEGMVKDHEEAVKLFETESKNGQDEAFKTWAGKTLPVLKMHREMAQKLAKKDKKES